MMYFLVRKDDKKQVLIRNTFGELLAFDSEELAQQHLKYSKTEDIYDIKPVSIFTKGGG